MCGVCGRWDDLRRDRAHQREHDGASQDRVFPSGEMAAMYNVTGFLKIRVCREMPRKKGPSWLSREWGEVSHLVI